MSNYQFSHKNYSYICKTIKNTGLLCDYKDVLKNNLDNFIVLRHDVDISVKRAYELGKIEFQHGIKSSFFFMLTSGMYNVLSSENISYLQDLSKMGHSIGIHYYARPTQSVESIKVAISLASSILQEFTSIKIDRFSFHNPTPALLKQNIYIDSLINAYSNKFFTFNECAANDNEFKPDIKYISDSNGKWQYTKPYTGICPEIFDEFSKFQLLLHPFYWTKEGHGHLENLKKLFAEQKKSTLFELENNEVWSLEYHGAL